ncbi:MAG: hypothetical protein ACRDJ5_02340, partial [Actinomycetota bacterium]
MSQPTKQLGTILLEKGLVSPEQMQAVAEEERQTGKSAWKLLLERNIVSERDLLRARAAQIGMEFADVSAQPPGADALSLVPQEVARRQLALPVRVHNGTLTVAMAEPRNHLAVEEIQRLSGKAVTVAVAYRPDLLTALERAYAPVPSAAP